MNQLSKNEKKAYVALSAAPDQTLGVDALAEAVYGSSPPSCPRQSICAMLRILTLKLQNERVSIVRVSKTGRGVLGVWKLVTKAE